MKQIAIFAGGCFWCVEHDLRSMPGVIEVISGYAGLNKINPTYVNHEGFREAVKVIYDSDQTNFKRLTQFFLDHIDAADGGGQFGDRGESYTTAIYFSCPEEKTVAEALLHELDEAKIYPTPVKVKVLPLEPFFPAEDYHQDYAAKNPDAYERYRQVSGRADHVDFVCQWRKKTGLNWKD